MTCLVKLRTAAFIPQHGAPQCITARFHPGQSVKPLGGFTLDINIQIIIPDKRKRNFMKWMKKKRIKKAVLVIQCSNLMSLNRGLNLPKTGFN